MIFAVDLDMSRAPRKPSCRTLQSEIGMVDKCLAVTVSFATISIALVLAIGYCQIVVALPANIAMLVSYRFSQGQTSRGWPLLVASPRSGNPLTNVTTVAAERTAQIRMLDTMLLPDSRGSTATCQNKDTRMIGATNNSWGLIRASVRMGNYFPAQFDVNTGTLSRTPGLIPCAAASAIDPNATEMITGITIPLVRRAIELFGGGGQGIISIRSLATTRVGVNAAGDSDVLSEYADVSPHSISISPSTPHAGP